MKQFLSLPRRTRGSRSYSSLTRGLTAVAISSHSSATGSASSSSYLSRTDEKRRSDSMLFQKVTSAFSLFQSSLPIVTEPIAEGSASASGLLWWLDEPMKTMSVNRNHSTFWLLKINVGSTSASGLRSFSAHPVRIPPAVRVATELHMSPDAVEPEQVIDQRRRRHVPRWKPPQEPLPRFSPPPRSASGCHFRFPRFSSPYRVICYLFLKRSTFTLEAKAEVDPLPVSTSGPPSIWHSN